MWSMYSNKNIFALLGKSWKVVYFNISPVLLCGGREVTSTGGQLCVRLGSLIIGRCKVSSSNVIDDRRLSRCLKQSQVDRWTGGV